jgi:hypothetical protein
MIVLLDYALLNTIIIIIKKIPTSQLFALKLSDGVNEYELKQE